MDDSSDETALLPSVARLAEPVPRRRCCAAALGVVLLLGLWAAVSRHEHEAPLEARELREQNARIREENRRLEREKAQLQDEAARLQRLNEQLHRSNVALHDRALGAVGPYEAITGSKGHELPEMYGKVREKTIWSYWYQRKACASAVNCTLPAHVQLCVESVARNKGSFDHVVLHMDEVPKYVNMLELPLRWRELTAQHQKDAVMNAVLARYGGLALDITTVLLRPLDDYWEEMLAKRATFFGYIYRLNGQPYRHPEVSVVWFLMSRRDGLFCSAVRNQVQGMGDRRNIKGVYHQFYYALGDQTLLPVLSLFNYSLPKCDQDETLLEPVDHCPEREQPPWYTGIAGDARNDTRLLLRDPRDGPQLPMAMSGMALWNVSNVSTPLPPGDPRFRAQSEPGGPMQGETCASMKDCWETVFLRRYHQPAKAGEAKLLSFVKLFSAGGPLLGKSREELLAMKDSYFYHWLKLAGLPV